MLDKLKTFVKIAARMTKMPMLNIRSRMAFCFHGTLSLRSRGSGMKSMSVSEEILKQAWTMA